MLVILLASAATAAYAYLGYPALLWIVSRVRRAPRIVTTEPITWPTVSITLPAYNAKDTLRPVLEALVHTEYPVDRRQILVVSDGSSDGTDDLVREYASRGVELLRVEGRLGKTEVENRAFDALRGEIIVNTDASVTIRPDAVRRLVAALSDPAVGVASARDISVATVGERGRGDEAAYVGYEMWIRDLETAAEGIIGSSGCLYAIRASLHRRELPGRLSRDFSSALWARLNGFRAVSVRDAVCFVPRAANVRIEFRRKIRTMSRGIQTLFFHAQLLNPLRFGLFAWFLWSHKLIRWLVPVALVLAAGSVLVLAPTHRWALAASALLVTAMLLAAIGWYWTSSRPIPRIASMAAYFVSGTIAALIAWKRAMLDDGAPVWEPTPRVVSPVLPQRST